MNCRSTVPDWRSSSDAVTGQRARRRPELVLLALCCAAAACQDLPEAVTFPKMKGIDTASLMPNAEGFHLTGAEKGFQGAWYWYEIPDAELISVKVQVEGDPDGIMGTMERTLPAPKTILLPTSGTSTPKPTR